MARTLTRKRGLVKRNPAIIKASQFHTLVLATALGLSFPAHGVTIVNDTWTDGTRSDPAPPVYSENGTNSDADGNIESAWFFGASAGATFTASAGHLVGTVGASSVHWTTYFTPEANPLTLINSGDQIRITWIFTPTGVNLSNTNQDFRLAVVDTPAGVRLTSDATASAASGYTGYGMFMNMGQTLGGTNSFQLGRRVAATSATLLGNATDYNLLTNGATSGNHGYDSGTTYTYVMTLTRNGAGIDINSTMTGGSLNGNGSATVSYSDPTPPGFKFDTFHIRPSTGTSTTASSFDTTLFKVEFIPASSAPVVQFATTGSSGLETVSPVVLNVKLSQVMTQAVSVSYAVTGGTATGGGVDYTLAPGTLTFNPGETNKTISIPITNDGLAESGETIVVTLTGVVTNRPELQIGRSAGDVILSWPQSYAGYTLESRTNLVNLPYWAAVTNQVVLSNGLNQVTVSLTGQSQFFRLRGAGDGATVQLGVQTHHIFTIIENNNQPVVLAEYVGSSFSAFNHASSIAQTPDGALVATWYGGSAEGASDVSIWVSRNDGSGWSPRIEVDSGPPQGGATWNPVLFQPRNGPLLLFYKYDWSPAGWEGSMRTSIDKGITWSARIPLPTTNTAYLSSYAYHYIGPVKNRPLELPDGRLLCGSSTEDNGWQVHMEIAGTTNSYTTDYRLIRVGGTDAIQPTFLVHDDSYQTIQAICRPKVTGLAKTTWSYDGGNTWSSLSTVPLTVDAGLHALTVTNLNSAGRRWHILAYNPSSTRDPLRIAISQDGTNWTVAIPSLDSGNKMDYPTLMQSPDKLLHLTYSYYNHTKIKHVVIDPYVLLNEPRP